MKILSELSFILIPALAICIIMSVTDPITPEVRAIEPVPATDHTARIDSLQSLVHDLRYQRDHCHQTIISWNEKGYIHPELYRPRP